jgi:putative flippase GtrA
MKLTHQIQRFLMTGGVNTLFGYAVYVFGVVMLDLAYFWAVVLSYVVGVTFSYFMFRTFVFKEGERGWRSYARFIPTYVVLMFINIISMWVLVDFMNWNNLLAQAIVVPGCAALSFIINRIFVFK